MEKRGFPKLAGQIILFIAGVVIFFVYLPNYTRLTKLKRENARLIRDIDSLKREIDKFKSDIEKLENGSFIWEELARQNLGVVKEGEIVVDIRNQE